MIVNKKKMLQLIHKAVKERGADWVYPAFGEGCVYQWDHDGEGREKGQPACLVGQALHYIDPKLLDLLVEEGLNSQTSASALLDWLEETSDVHFTRGAISAACVAQSAQDMGASWGEAERRARAA